MPTDEGRKALVELWKTPAGRKQIWESIRGKKPRKGRKAAAIAADNWWDYRMECWKRSPRRKDLLEAAARSPHDPGLMEKWIDQREEVRTAPVLPVATDGTSWVTLKIDFRIPHDLTLALVEEHLQDFSDDFDLRRAVADTAYSNVTKVLLDDLRDHPPTAFERLLFPRRIHPKTLRLRLRVWDSVRKNRDLSEIAARLGKRTNQVEGLFWEAFTDICKIPRPPESKERGPRGRPRKRPVVEFNPDKHRKGCPKCKNFNRFEELCDEARAYVTGNTVSQRHLVTADIEAVAKAAGSVADLTGATVRRRPSGRIPARKVE
jgi:hypothetical protein